MTVCVWVDGQYEDTVFRGDDRPQSQVTPAWGITVRQILTDAESDLT
ncbi:MAG: hypothetical protein RML75_00490 [Cyanobacteriota bacterium SKYGB_h_bin112]|nr:hypothetical protein [Cyanobacteriota bacterium SKYGB_h_bin112]